MRPEGRAKVYLDVSGSMNAEMPLVVALLKAAGIPYSQLGRLPK